MLPLHFRNSPNLRVNARDAFAFALHRQHVLAGSQSERIEEVADTLVGIHAARLSTPFFALRSRLRHVRYHDLDAALHQQRILVKARCMRGTLHLLTSETFALVHHATLHKRLGVCSGMYRKLGADSLAIRRLKDQVLDLVTVEAMPAARIEALCGQNKALVRAVVKELWERGDVCYVNRSSKFGKEDRLYGSMAALYPAHAREAKSDSSTTVLVRRYLRGYAPATIRDIAWWSGLEKTRVLKALGEMESELAIVHTEGHEEPFLVLREDLSALVDFRAPTEDWVAILAHEDPSLKGYFSSRLRYVAEANYSRLFNDIGESRASIMLNGELVGIWSLDREQCRIDVKLFGQIGRRQTALVKSEVQAVQKTLPALLDIV